MNDEILGYARTVVLMAEAGKFDAPKTENLARALIAAENRIGELEGALATALEWTDEDKPIPEDELIGAAHPTEGGDEDIFANALRMVGAKRSKGALVDLVNWLLHERQYLEQVRLAMRRSELIARFLDAGFWDAHYVNLKWRHNGQDITEQADWLLDVWYAVRRRARGHVPAGIASSDSTATGGSDAFRA